MQLTRTNKILLSLGSLGVAATIAGAGTWATFTDTDTATQAVSAGTVQVSLNTDNDGTVLTAISNVAPGDTFGREITLSNDGSLDLASVTLSGVALSEVGAPGDDELFTDEDNGLQLSIYDCAVAWVAPVTSEDEWACDGADVSGLTAVLGQADAVDAAGALSGVATDSGGTENLLALFEVPGDLDNEAQGDSGTLTLTFVAEQRAGENS